MPFGHTLAVLALATPAVAGNDFVEGDFYIFTHDWPGVGAAVARVDPIDGATTILHEPEFALNAQLSYDPWRDVLVTMPNTNVDVFEMIDVNGVMTELPNPWDGPFALASWAPTGDGRIYMVTNGNGHFGYMDADDNGHTLYDVDGVTPFFFAYGSTSRENLIYDVGTNSLVLVHWGVDTEVTRFPLSADGTQLAAPPICATFDAFDGAEEPMGMSAGPNGTLFIKIDTNSSAAGLRMFTVDPVTMTFAPYAYLGGPFVAANTAGTYNSTHDFALAMDTFDNILRSYVESGAVQEGVEFATGVSGSGGSGEQTRIISIGDTINGAAAPCDGDANGDGSVGVTDLIGLLGAWGSADPQYDIAPPGGDGVVDSNDMLAMLAGWGPCP